MGLLFQKKWFKFNLQKEAQIPWVRCSGLLFHKHTHLFLTKIKKGRVSGALETLLRPASSWNFLLHGGAVLTFQALDHLCLFWGFM